MRVMQDGCLAADIHRGQIEGEFETGERAES